MTKYIKTGIFIKRLCQRIEDRGYPGRSTAAATALSLQSPNNQASTPAWRLKPSPPSPSAVAGKKQALILTRMLRTDIATLHKVARQAGLIAK